LKLTFHMPLGETTVTLKDVSLQLRVPIDGEPAAIVLRFIGGHSTRKYDHREPDKAIMAKY